MVSCTYEFIFAHWNTFSSFIPFIEFFFTKASSKKIAKGIRYIFFSIGILIAIALLLVGRYAFSIPILLFLIPLIKLKGIADFFQLFQLWRLIQYLRSTGRYSFSSGANYSKASSNISLDDAYNILGM